MSVDRTTEQSDEQRKLVDQLAKSISGLCHTVIARRLGQFFEVIGEELQKPRADVRDDIAPLMGFYEVATLEDLVLAQARHVERLQAKLPPLRDEFPRTPREG